MMIMPACWVYPQSRWITEQYVKRIRELLGGALPITVVVPEELEEGISVSELCCRVGFCLSRNEGRVLIRRRDIQVNGSVVTDEKGIVTGADLIDGGILLRLGEKTYHWIAVGGESDN